MRLEQLGWNDFFQNQKMPVDCIPARVSQQQKKLYRVISEQGEFLSEISGRVCFQLAEQSEFPAVGDWAAIQPIGNGRAIVRFLFSRKTSISRKAAGKPAEQQIVCANMDYI